MKEKNENKLDQLFRDGISGSEDRFAFREEDWESMEQLLDKKSNKKAGLFRIIYFASGIAALLLLAIGLYFYYNNDITNPKQTKQYSGNSKKTTPYKDSVSALQSGRQLQQPATTGQQDNLAAGTSPGSDLPGADTGARLPHKKNIKNKVDNKSQNIAAIDDNSQHGKTGNSTGNDVSGIKKPVAAEQPQNLAATINDKVQNPGVAGIDTPGKTTDSNVPQNNIATNKPDTTTNKITKQETKTQMAVVKQAAIKNRPQFSIAVLAASDANAVNSFGRSQTGTNFGLQLSLRLTKKLTISTGAAYAIKPYSASAGSYSSSSYNPSISPINVQANCKVLDIPLNVSYQVYSKGNNAIALGTGVSSYFMLKENYRFDYSAESGWKPYNIEVRNKNRHPFGVLNIDVNYQRRINSKFSIVAQPYMKLPLTGIGNGHVDLKSTGVALGINWNIGSALKP